MMHFTKQVKYYSKLNSNKLKLECTLVSNDYNEPKKQLGC